jgi:hypothetical protein
MRTIFIELSFGSWRVVLSLVFKYKTQVPISYALPDVCEEVSPTSL